MQRVGPAAIWGIVGVIALLAQALIKLTPIAVSLADVPLSPLELATLVGWIAFNGYAEGYRGFHQNFAPRVVARALHLAAHPRPLYIALAPIYCMGLVHATRKRLIVSWILTLAIVAIVIAVRHLVQPWRGIVDAGVVAGLAVGVVSIVYYTARAARGHAMPVLPDVPR